jgi:putative zinc finger protein
MAGQPHNGMQCSEFDALLSQAIDGTLSGERLTAFEAHGRECRMCGPLLQEAEAGRSWLKSLEEVEPPLELVNHILLATTGVAARDRAAAQTWLGRVRELAEVIVSPILAVARQPRFAMSFGMAFFTLSVSLSLAGVKLSDIRHVDLRPSAIRRTYYETSGRVVKYYENIRFVYEIESRVQQFKRATAPAEQRREEPNNNQRKENKDNSSGQPEPRQERNYSQGEGNLIYASLPDSRGTPVVNGATYRRFV